MTDKTAVFELGSFAKALRDQCRRPTGRMGRFTLWRMNLPLTGMALLSVDEHRELFTTAGYSDVRVIEEPGKGWICSVGRK